MTKEQKKLTKKLIGSAVVIALFVGAVYLVFYLLGWTNLTREQLQAFITQTGVVAPIVYIFISFLQVTIVPIPAAITILAGNYVFGAVGAFIYSYIGTLFFVNARRITPLACATFIAVFSLVLK